MFVAGVFTEIKMSSRKLSWGLRMRIGERFVKCSRYITVKSEKKFILGNNTGISE